MINGVHTSRMVRDFVHQISRWCCLLLWWNCIGPYSLEKNSTWEFERSVRHASNVFYRGWDVESLYNHKVFNFLRRLFYFKKKQPIKSLNLVALAKQQITNYHSQSPPKVTPSKWWLPCIPRHFPETPGKRPGTRSESPTWKALKGWWKWWSA